MFLLSFIFILLLLFLPLFSFLSILILSFSFILPFFPFYIAIVQPSRSCVAYKYNTLCEKHFDVHEVVVCVKIKLQDILFLQFARYCKLKSHNCAKRKIKRRSRHCMLSGNVDVLNIKKLNSRIFEAYMLYSLVFSHLYPRSVILRLKDRILFAEINNYKLINFL